MTISATSQGLKPGVCTSSNRPANPYDGMMIYETDTDLVKVWNGSTWAGVGVSKVKKIAAFTASGTWTVPTGVTYAIAHIRAGGGSTGTASWATGGTSSVAFAGGTVSATGGGGFRIRYIETNYHTAGTTNSGQGGSTYGTNGAGDEGQFSALSGAHIVAGGSVTAGAGIAITVGAGAAAGTSGAAGGSGYVWIEYEE